ncbi:alanine racemase [Candidatus Micrarchaeota archaeon]|nr:alanine racemase [Candidatus Micrarchaeota archaeon]
MDDGVLDFAGKRGVLLVAATKYASAERINSLLAQGVKAIGENRVKDAEEKLPLVGKCEKHFFGRMQSNKLGTIVSLFDVVDSLCDCGHAVKLDAHAEKQGKIIRVLVQVNAGAEAAKQGLPLNAAEVRKFLVGLKPLKNIKVEGLMVVVPEGEGGKYFGRAKKLFDSLREEFNLKYLSMGTSEGRKDSV